MDIIHDLRLNDYLVTLQFIEELMAFLGVYSNSSGRTRLKTAMSACLFFEGKNAGNLVSKNAWNASWRLMLFKNPIRNYFFVFPFFLSFVENVKRVEISFSSFCK